MGNNKDFKSRSYIFKDFNVKFTQGKIYVLSGANGVGKTSLVNLIIGLYINEYYGDILYNNINIKELDMVKIRKNLIGFAEQEPVLINDNVIYNITYNKYDFINYSNGHNVSEKSYYLLNNLINNLQLDRFIKEKGLSFRINENSTNISGGEKQKLAILKVLNKTPDVMIFDEPTSALDSKTILSFMDYLHEIKSNHIIIIISHDNYVKSNSDEIVTVHP